MKKIRSELLEMLLFIICLALFALLLPKKLILYTMAGLFIFCITAMVKRNIFRNS